MFWASPLRQTGLKPKTSFQTVASLHDAFGSTNRHGVSQQDNAFLVESSRTASIREWPMSVRTLMAETLAFYEIAVRKDADSAMVTGAGVMTPASLKCEAPAGIAEESCSRWD